jgi:hypothetical protein
MVVKAEPQYVAQTLAWCNRKRAEQGKKSLTRLPKGRRGDGYSCPCGKAVGFWVGHEEFEYKEEHDISTEPVPRSVGRFVAAFDDGRFPQYEAKS